MYPHVVTQVLRLWNLQRSCPTRLKQMMATILAGVCAAVVLVLPAAAIAAQEGWTPPPVPPIPPVIGTEYQNDADKNGVDDQLQARARSALKLSAAGARSRDSLAGTADEMVAVELIFSAPVTQAQIDAFAELGGTITHMYQTVSYGWNGRIALKNIDVLPAVMGSSLVQVEPTVRINLYSDKATAAGRARATWKSGFAGNVAGFNGDPNTTIGFIDTGVDANHKDLAGRCVYWSDLSGADSPTTTDDYGHGTRVTGLACGTGLAAGAATGPFTYTYTDSGIDYAFLGAPVALPQSFLSVTSRAYWIGSGTRLYHVCWSQGAMGSLILYQVGSYVGGTSGMTLTNSFTANPTYSYAPYLYNPTYQFMAGAVVVTTISKYPAAGDGFNRFRGIAPGCNYAMVNMDAEDESNAFSVGLDLLVFNRISKNIKIVNISGGLSSESNKGISLRNKVTTAVNNGMVVVAAAGNSATATAESDRVMTDPARAALAITVGASNDRDALTEYSTYGFANPSTSLSEDFKPDVIAPGGSWYYTGVITPDSGTSDAYGEDQEPNDYAVSVGTSFSSPFVAGCAALVIQAMERQGTVWDYSSSAGPRFVKMVLCATASETNANREDNNSNPTLQRATGGPSSFPSGKDPYEGYGMINPDAALEAVTLTYTAGSSADDTFGTETTDRRVWARTMKLTQGLDVSVTLTNPTTGDFDMYLYSSVPSDSGTPVLLASSTNAGKGVAEKVDYTPTADGKAFLVVKKVAGSGKFTVSSLLFGPPVAADVTKSAGINSAATITLTGSDDGVPNPPGKLTYTIASLPRHGTLEQVGGGAAITTAPTDLPAGVAQVVYRPSTDWVGDDSFTYYCSDGGTAPASGRSNTATVSVATVREVTVAYQVAAGADDAHYMRGLSTQKLTEPALAVGQSNAGMRFSGVNIPRGAHIVQATLKVRSYTSGLYTLFTALVAAEAADNAFDFNARLINNVSATTATRSWVLDTGWQGNTWYESPDIANVVQEVVNRSGWSANNALVILLQGATGAANDRKVWSYDGDPASAAQLEVTYQP
jgi:subtilisin family serine protease